MLLGTTSLFGRGRWDTRCRAGTVKTRFYRWTRHRIHSTLIVVNRYLGFTGIKRFQTRLRTVYPPFAVGICLPHQGAVDLYNLSQQLRKKRNNNSLRLSDAIWHNKYWSTLYYVTACCVIAPSHYINHCWLVINWTLNKIKKKTKKRRESYGISEKFICLCRW